jgi:hypothetical protein
MEVKTSGFVLPCPAGIYKGNVSVCVGNCAVKTIVVDVFVCQSFDIKPFVARYRIRKMVWYCRNNHYNSNCRVTFEQQ